MFLIVGLGNPGAQYARTRHNIGWMVLDELAGRWNIEFSRTSNEAKVGGGLLGDQRVLLAKPQTFMNLSGRSVGALLRYHNLSPDRLLVVTDDLNLPVARLRVRPGGSHGGHNGLKSIAEHLGHTNFARLRFGVGEPPNEERQERGTKDYVLSPFLPVDAQTVAEGIRRAADCIELWTREGTDAAMGRFNAAIDETI